MDGSTVAPPVALYVGDLDATVDEAALLDVFKTYQDPVSVRICLDAVSKRSLGYGYVNYKDLDTAMGAIEKLNHTPVNGKSIRIMMSCRDSGARKAGVGNVYVKNLGDSIDNVKLNELFADFGKILSCKVATSEDGKSKGHGFVQFEDQECANSAIEKLNGFEIGGKQIFVTHFQRQNERDAPNPETKFTNLYMKNLSLDITEELLRLKFSEFGTISSLYIAIDGSGNFKGFAFVNYNNPDDAKRAMDTMNGAQLGSQVLYVARAQKKVERKQILKQLHEENKNVQSASNLYVKNIQDEVNDEDFRAHFSAYGTVKSAIIMRNERGISKGFGFVCFQTPEEAKEAIKMLHGSIFRGKPLYVAVAQKKKERQVILQEQFAKMMESMINTTNTVIPPGIPGYYTAPPGVMAGIPQPQGFMYPTLGVGPGWTPNGFPVPGRMPFQPPFPASQNISRNHRFNTGRANGHTFTQTSNSMYHVPYLQQYDPANSLKYSQHLQKRNGQRNWSNGRQGDASNASVAPHGAPNSLKSQIVSRMLDTAPSQQQKQIIGESLFPLVQGLRPNLASKITGMLLEMDKTEVLLLLDSPGLLAAKVDEAVEVLGVSQGQVAVQEVAAH